MTEVEILPETTFDFWDFEDELAMLDPTELVAGETYLVTWGGKEYNCEAVDVGEGIMLGDVYTVTDGQIGKESTGEPFVIMSDYGESATMVVHLDDSRIQTISITQRTETIKPLDEKYLPNLTSPSGKKFKLTVDDNGTITATEV